MQTMEIAMRLHRKLASTAATLMTALASLLSAIWLALSACVN